jgi:hypothetical protein
MKNQHSVSPPKLYNLTTESKDSEISMINDLKGISNKQKCEVRKTIQVLDKKVSNMGGKFSKEMKIMNKKQVEKLEMKIK